VALQPREQAAAGGVRSDVARFRKKAVVIDAVPVRDVLRAASRDWKALPKWLAEEYERGNIVFAASDVHIRTLEGTLIAQPDDMLIRGIKGEIYPCKPDIFAATYESAEPEAEEHAS
jgi:hypothetical protein